MRGIHETSTSGSGMRHEKRKETIRLMAEDETDERAIRMRVRIEEHNSDLLFSFSSAPPAIPRFPRPHCSLLFVRAPSPWQNIRIQDSRCLHGTYMSSMLAIEAGAWIAIKSVFDAGVCHPLSLRPTRQGTGGSPIKTESSTAMQSIKRKTCV